MNAMKNINCPTPWLGATHGYLTDWITQRWVQMTGRKVDFVEHSWLNGPIGKPQVIGAQFFDEMARELGLEVRRDNLDAGLLPDFSQLDSSCFESSIVNKRVVHFYEHTARYNLDAWGEWCGLFRPFGKLLAFFFSRRLQQLNVPISSLDTSRGISSEIIQLMDEATNEVRYTAWVRKLVETGNVLYAGSYSLCRVPNHDGLCVKVVFPLPNGSAIVVMKPQVHPDGSFSVISSGAKFGDPGFYFLVKNASGTFSARYVRAMRETIHVYADNANEVRANHVLKLFGITFLRLHYRLEQKHG